MAGGTMDCSVSRQGSQWSDLPEGLLESISSKVADISDYIRFRAVCKSWRSAAIPTKHMCPQVPWLMLPYHSTSPKFSFLSLTSKRAYTFDLPEIHGKVIVGFSHGWLVILDRSATSMFLFNPLTRNQIQLPPPSNLSRRFWADLGGTSPYTRNIWRAFLSSSPSSNDCIVTVVIRGTRQFAFCRPGDRAWTVLHNTLPSHIQTIAYQKQQMYIIDLEGNTAICDANPASRPTLVPSLKVPDTDVGSDLHMVNTSGHELLLLAMRPYRVKNSTGVWKLDYSVLKLDQLGWSVAESIGQNTIFLSYSNSFCIFTTDSNSGCTPDCIYFPAHPRRNFEGLASQPLDSSHDIWRLDVHRKNVVKDEVSYQISYLWKVPGWWLAEPQWFVPALN